MTTRAVIVICDSLRRDLIAPNRAPTLSHIRSRSANFTGARGVFPSVTRVSAASLATGCHPGNHGLIGNTMVLDEGDGLTCLSVGHPEFRHRLRAATGRTLKQPTLAERLRDHGGAIAFSNVSPGAAYFLDPDHHGHVYHRAGSFAPGGDKVPAADELAIESGVDGDAAMTERFCQDVLMERRPALAILWLSEPDWTGHKSDLGSPEHLDAIAAADRNAGQVFETLDGIDPSGEQILRIVCSDHGMETVARRIDLDALLVSAGLKRTATSNDVVVAPNGTAALIHLAPEARTRLADLAAFLEGEDWVGRVYAGDDLARLGLVSDGTLGIAITLRSDPTPNAFGVAGHSDIVTDPQEPGSYKSQHGGLGAGEQSPFLFMSGGGFQAGDRPDSASLIDIAPTVLRHLGLPHDGMDGRPLPDPPFVNS